MFNTVGLDQNAHMVNIGGDHITHIEPVGINDGVGMRTYEKVVSIEERLKAVHDRNLGMSDSCAIPKRHD